VIKIKEGSEGRVDIKEGGILRRDIKEGYQGRMSRKGIKEGKKEPKEGRKEGRISRKGDEDEGSCRGCYRRFRRFTERGK
jgi:hypothetical protein